MMIGVIIVITIAVLIIDDSNKLGPALPQVGVAASPRTDSGSRGIAAAKTKQGWGGGCAREVDCGKLIRRRAPAWRR